MVVAVAVEAQEVLASQQVVLPEEAPPQQLPAWALTQCSQAAGEVEGVEVVQTTIPQLEPGVRQEAGVR